MRDYALTIAQTSLSEALIPKAIQCLKTALMRRKIRKVLLTGRGATQLGLAATDLHDLLALPVSCNLAMEMERISFLKTHT